MGDSQLGTTGSAGGWTKIGNLIHTIELFDKVGIFTTNSNSLLSVGGKEMHLLLYRGLLYLQCGIGIYGESPFYWS
ncbi:MAG: hypothetical protein H6613_18445 [Ignavibacteriales bacterium]|nr:hypothetical protein [Ignavibacteriales bacterium]